MHINRVYTKRGQSVFDQFAWSRRDVILTGKDGKVLFDMKGVEVPKGWSDHAAQILATKYFRKAGVPLRHADKEYINLFDDDVRRTLQVNDDGHLMYNGQVLTGPERSLRQVAHRIAGCWTQWGKDKGYFTPTMEEVSEIWLGHQLAEVLKEVYSPEEMQQERDKFAAENASAFYDEMVYMICAQIGAPNSPQWFNTGLAWAYGIQGPPQGHWIADHKTGEVSLATDAYTHPQPHACFIQSIEDTLVGDGSIMDLWTREARLFKFGSGTGTNFSNLRAANEPLSSGGRSSGLMSWLKIGDRAAAAVKSGGTTRRAAKMVCLDADHPDIVEFIQWKSREEIKVKAMVEGMSLLSEEDRAYAKHIGLDVTYDYEGEAYGTVSGQNSNNSVRASDTFMQGIAINRDWDLIPRTSGKHGGKNRTVKTRDVWDEIVTSAWRSGDPGLQFDTTINDWHTCPNSGRINASNPCSEFMFLDNTACNLASLNVVRFYDHAAKKFDVDKYVHAVNLWTIALEISVTMAAFPSRDIAHMSWRFRPLGLGFANLGALLMQIGLPYDHPASRGFAASLASIMSGAAYACSGRMASVLGPFDGYKENTDAMMRVVYNHRQAASLTPRYRSIAVKPPVIEYNALLEQAIRIGNVDEIVSRSQSVWEEACEEGLKYGFRNSQVTVIAPTGTIGFVMDCDTTGVEPVYALKAYKVLAGGGGMEIVCNSVENGLRALNLDDSEVQAFLTHIDKTGSIEGAFQSEASGRFYNLNGHNAFPEDDFTAESVFACASRCGKDGKQIIQPFGHIHMMAAVQPFLSGAISKTINLPNDATPSDIENAYLESWKSGLKAVALYRDGCKRSQPLNAHGTSTSADEGSKLTIEIDARNGTVKTNHKGPMEVKYTNGSTRERLPDTRPAITHKFNVGGHEGYLNVGFYDDGRVGELFVTMSKAGSLVNGMLGSWATAISIALQHGAPLESIVSKFSHQKFEPQGMTEHATIRFASSVVDYIARWLKLEFLDKPGHPVIVTSKDEEAPKENTDTVSMEPSADGPVCRVCGTLMQRSGACHKCPKCGENDSCGG